ncbi:hypothetical protein LOC67_24710 [Stieleria sp. JC731]|uniref:hypothetical protein n=1 Tax=Stieleria sp. JC731 TaxID=2894195 RepID=UPI001E36FEB0|nr:hypothetical protein [Stieleria sp. JC731]MCC9603765.1 hypothetical protein [Stieleria sp. JC731]
MNRSVNQSDWKRFRVVRDGALERLCERALDAISATISEKTLSHHARFLQVYEKVHEYNDQVANGFDDLSRSRMIQQIAYLRSMNLISDTEMEGFTQETQDVVARFLGY